MFKLFTKRSGEIFKRRFFNFFKKETPKPEEKKPVEPPKLKPKTPHTKVNTFSFPNIKHIIAVASGKGGVGKSTVSGLKYFLFKNSKFGNCSFFRFQSKSWSCGRR
jgi:hypothetical protein